MTPYQKHRQRWKNCSECSLCRTRKNVVLARGNVPCDVLFIGEAPGLSEDALGKPFIGPAGKLLDDIIEQAWLNAESEATYALTNLIACIPKDEAGSKAVQPPEESIEACDPRLQEFVRLCRPVLVVLVGQLAEKYGPKSDQWQTISIVHPAAIIRMNISQQGLAKQKCVVQLTEALEELDA